MYIIGVFIKRPSNSLDPTHFSMDWSGWSFTTAARLEWALRHYFKVTVYETVLAQYLNIFRPNQSPSGSQPRSARTSTQRCMVRSLSIAILGDSVDWSQPSGPHELNFIQLYATYIEPLWVPSNAHSNAGSVNVVFAFHINSRPISHVSWARSLLRLKYYYRDIIS